MAYTLKSNATTATISRMFVGENGLVELIGGGSITATGAGMVSSTVGGHTVYGRGASGGVSAQYLTLASVAAIGAGVKFAVLLVGGPTQSPNDTDVYVQAPGANQFGTNPGPVAFATINGNNVIGPSSTGWETGLHTTIYGRKTDNSMAIYHDGTVASATGNSAWTIAAGSWNFGGTPIGGTNAGYGVGLFAVFIGVGPDELATYIAAGGADAYTALLDVAGGGGGGGSTDPHMTNQLIGRLLGRTTFGTRR